MAVVYSYTKFNVQYSKFKVAFNETLNIKL